MEKKKRRLVFLGLLLTMGVSFLSFQLGMRWNEKDVKKISDIETMEAETAAEGAWTAFGRNCMVICPAFSDGTFCDFSIEATPSSLLSLADRLLPELEGKEQIAKAAAFYWRDKGNVYHGMDELHAGNILGIDPDFLSASGFQVEKGRGLTERDVEEKRQVALLDGRSANALFSGTDPVGETIEVEGRLYQIAGVVSLGGSQTDGGLVLIPESTWPEIYQYEEPKSVVIRASEKNMDRETTTRLAQAAARTLNSMIPETEPIHYKPLPN
ncbi:MAG: ABC transporter permease [Lachnospiraceae bacterium]|nr:ABC transporter permease [Lachnospiraceae bacterium]